MSAARHIALAPAPSASVVSLDDWRATRRVPAEFAPEEHTPLRLLRLVVDGEAPRPFRLEVFLRRAQAVMNDPQEPQAVPSYLDAEPA